MVKMYVERERERERKRDKGRFTVTPNTHNKYMKDKKSLKVVKIVPFAFSCRELKQINGSCVC
jgi:hypothetical protein